MVPGGRATRPSPPHSGECGYRELPRDLRNGHLAYVMRPVCPVTLLYPRRLTLSEIPDMVTFTHLARYTLLKIGRQGCSTSTSRTTKFKPCILNATTIPTPRFRRSSRFCGSKAKTFLTKPLPDSPEFVPAPCSDTSMNISMVDLNVSNKTTTSAHPANSTNTPRRSRTICNFSFPLKS